MDRYITCVTLSNDEVIQIKDDKGKQRLAEILLKANLDSVNYRYSEKSEAKIKYRFYNYEQMGAVGILKQCDCYEYQSCETPDYYESDAHKIIEKVRRSAIHRLPGYEQAEWGIS